MPSTDGTEKIAFFVTRQELADLFEVLDDWHGAFADDTEMDVDELALAQRAGLLVARLQNLVDQFPAPNPNEDLVLDTSELRANRS